MATPNVRAANAAPPSVLAPHLPRSLPTHLATLSLHRAADLSPRTRDTLYTLFDTNMTPLAANTSMLHTPAAKREEMFDPDARYLLAVREEARMPGALPPTPPRPRRGDVEGPVDVASEDLLGFASFRYDTEETMGEQDVEVVYCYELQLSLAARRTGLGGILMAELERAGKARGMRKSMLTCLADNAPALAFYAKAGYTPDEIDPTRIAEEDDWEDVDEEGEGRRPDYRILSKEL